MEAEKSQYLQSTSWKCRRPMAQFQFKNWHARGSGELRCELDSKGRKRLSSTPGRLEKHYHLRNGLPFCPMQALTGMWEGNLLYLPR